MIHIYCFSATGRTQRISEYFSQTLSVPIHELPCTPTPCTTAIVIFPVYCQTLPAPVKSFLPQLSASHLVLIAAYGHMSYGNVLQEASALSTATVIAAACVPIGHTYLNEETDFDCSRLAPILERISSPHEITIPKMHKDLFAYLLPELRSRLGVRIKRTKACIDCRLCIKKCPVGAMNEKGPGDHCIRCLRCISVCPVQALEYSLTVPMRLYLGKKRCSELLILL